VSTYENQVSQLESQVSQLESDYLQLQSDYLYVLSEYEGLQQAYNNLQAENERLRTFLNELSGVPPGYYDVDMFPQHENTITGLTSFLDGGYLLQREYEEHIFDCSESTAYVEWALEDAGFDAYIAVGGSHSWVLVFTVEETVAVEATWVIGGYGSISIVHEGDPDRYNYFDGYDALFSDVFEIVQRYRIYEWNWWRGCWGICDID
jgi:hypothetical protein